MGDMNTDVRILNLASCVVVVYNVAFCKKTLERKTLEDVGHAKYGQATRILNWDHHCLSSTPRPSPLLEL